MHKRTVRSDGRSTSRILILSIASLASMAVLAVLATAVVLEIQSGARSYLLANNEWAKARRDAMLHLNIYAQTGEREHLEEARSSLHVLLKDRQARLAMEASPSRMDEARAHFRAAGAAPAEITRLIRIYYYFSDARHLAEAITAWEESDKYVLALEQLADRIENDMSDAALSETKSRQYLTELVSLDEAISPLEATFANKLAAGAGWLSNVLVTITAIVFALMTLIATGLYIRLLRHIRESEQDFRVTFEQAAVGMAQLDADGTLIAVNNTLASILGRDRQALMGTQAPPYIHPDERFGDPWRLKRLIAGDIESFSSENRYVRSEGETIWAKVTVSAIKNRAGRPDRFLAVMEDTTEARRLADTLSYQASHDKLTGLFNRQEIERRLAHFLDGARREHLRHSLLFIDLDQFKVVNDTCGHVAGDHLLCQLGELLEKTLRRSDIVGRLGGDEFAVVLDHTPASEALQLAERLRQAISAMTFRWDERTFNLSSSIGHVEITPDVPDVAWLLSAADTACYLAKDNGRNRIHSYVETDKSVAERRGQMEWVSDIRQAIEENRLRLFAQCIAPLHNNDGIYYELLVRLIDREGREYPPGAFLPAAERYDLASAVDRWVVGTALDALKSNPVHLKALSLCHINISGQSITDAEFLRFVEAKLDETGVPGRKLCFEVTETAAMTSMQDAVRFIDAMHARGCSIALDDFGSGLSSFGYLKHLPVDILKIDGIFVRDMATEALDKAIVESINDLGKSLGKVTIAEFVETREIADMLREAGVDFAQGYGLHRPAPLGELLSQTTAPCFASEA